MLFSMQVLRAPWWRSAVAVAVCTAVSAPVSAQDESQVSTLPVVVVTASRSIQYLQHTPVGATVITADMLANSGSVDVNEAIRKLGGVSYRSDLGNGREYALDLRGFGQTANQNLVVLVDGIRQSENEQTAARLTAIPLSQVERIEIVRGASSVVWGEGASAGVINIILKSRAGRDGTTGSITAAIESFQGSEVQLNLTRGWGKAHALEANVKKVASDGYRVNSAYDQFAGDVGYEWKDAGWDVKWRTFSEDQRSGFPGALTFVQFDTNPRQAKNANDFGETQVLQHTLHVKKSVGDASFGMDVSSRTKRTTSDISGYQMVSEAKTKEFSPYVTHIAELWGATATHTLGGFWQQWSRSNGEDTKARTRAVYLLSDWLLSTETRLSLGWRQERARKVSSTPFSAYNQLDQLQAHDVSMNQSLGQGWDVYGRLSRSYRLPNADDNAYFSQSLVPQINRDRELGVKWERDVLSAQVRIFRQKTRNEIAGMKINPTDMFPTNVNLDPTQRRGVELEGRWHASQSLAITGVWQHIKARFSEGKYAGQDMVLVPSHSASLRANFRLPHQQSLELGVQRLSAMRFDDDRDNKCGRRIPASMLLDARYAVEQAGWNMALSVSNLTDRKTYSLAFKCAEGGIYPEAGRAVRLSVTRRF